MTQTLCAWLAPVKDKLPPDFGPVEAQALYDAIAQEALRRFDAFLSGVRVYQSFPASRGEDMAADIVWERGTTRLLDYAPQSNGPAVFVVPSLVNRFEILDIDPDHSFLRFLVRSGLRPIVVDWQAPGAQEMTFSLSDYMTERLVPALEHAVQLNGGAPCHVLGYCMGGLLALALTLMRPKESASLTLMATPWDFAPKGVGGVPAASTALGQSFLDLARKWEPYCAQLGQMPASFLQTVFTSFQSVQVLHKFMNFNPLKIKGGDMRRFVLTEDWLNDGVPLTLPVARECLHDWYDKNLTAALQWSVAGCLVDPRKVAVPTYIMAPTKDKIVPPECALPLAALISGATLQQPVIGHIGLMTGDAAPDMVWKPYVSWLLGK